MGSYSERNPLTCSAISDLDAPKRCVVALSMCRSLIASVSLRYARYTDQISMFVQLESRNRMAVYLRAFKLNGQNQTDPLPLSAPLDSGGGTCRHDS
jgi:hypothetical protein